jgi:NAD(P)-dependent dehydrogenase (short-subunit alcohol dehydrogenase family)
VLISFSAQEINLKGPYIVARAFLHQHTPGKPAAIVMTSTIGSYHLVPTYSAYGASKAALNRVTEYIAAENKDDGVQAVAFHPGGVGGTDLTSKRSAFMQRFYTETPELAAGAIVYLTTQRAAYLSERYVDARWDLEQLERFKEKVRGEDLLKMSFLGDERFRM